MTYMSWALYVAYDVILDHIPGKYQLRALHLAGRPSLALYPAYNIHLGTFKRLRLTSWALYRTIIAILGKLGPEIGRRIGILGSISGIQRMSWVLYRPYG